MQNTNIMHRNFSVDILRLKYILGWFPYTTLSPKNEKIKQRVNVSIYWPSTAAINSENLSTTTSCQNNHDKKAGYLISRIWHFNPRLEVLKSRFIFWTFSFQKHSSKTAQLHSQCYILKIRTPNPWCLNFCAISWNYIFSQK